MNSGIDCHFHVIGPHARFPMHEGRSYTPPEAPLAAWQQTLGSLGICRGVVVQPSVYGTDNRALLAALAEGGSSFVGVAALPESATESELDALAAAGVRGLRFAHFEPGDPRGMGGFVPLAALTALAPRLRARDMHADLFTDSRLLPSIEDQLRAAAVPVVVDHMGRAPAALGATHAGLEALRRLLQEGWLWVKLSGVANLSEQAPEYPDARAIHDALVATNSERLVWGSDWPHTRPHGTLPSTEGLFGKLVAWTSDRAVRERILVDNPQRLYRLALRQGPEGC